MQTDYHFRILVLDYLLCCGFEEDRKDDLSVLRPKMTVSMNLSEQFLFQTFDRKYVTQIYLYMYVYL